jgi:hypothetical protein
MMDWMYGVKGVVEWRKRSRWKSEVVMVGGVKFRLVGNFERSIDWEGVE